MSAANPPQNVHERAKGHVEARTSSDSKEPHAVVIPPSSAMSRGGFYWLSSLTAESAPNVVKAGAVIALAVASMAIMLVVKVVLVEYRFTCFLFVASLQYLGTTIVLLVQRNVTKSIPAFPLIGFFRKLIVVMFPAQLFFVANTLTGLGASRDLSMPLFVLLRSFSIPMTLGLEWYLLGRVPPKLCSLGVGVMVLGAFVGAGFDLNVKLSGFLFVQANNLLTALQGVYLRKKIQDVSSILTSDGILFYNNVFAFVTAMIVLCTARRDELTRIAEFPYWNSPGFLTLLFASTFMGFAVSYSAFFCTKVNSALTTAMVGALKNVVVSFIGMFFSDYHFTYSSFGGVDIGVIGTSLYAAGEVVKARKSAAPAVSKPLKEDDEAIV